MALEYCACAHDANAAAGARRSRARRSRARRSRARRSRARRSRARCSRALRSRARRSRARRSRARRSRARRSRARRSRARRSRAQWSPWSRARCSTVSLADGARRVQPRIEQPAPPPPERHRAWAEYRCCPHPSQSIGGSIQDIRPAASPRIIPMGRRFDACFPVQQNGPYWTTQSTILYVTEAVTIGGQLTNTPLPES